MSSEKNRAIIAQIKARALQDAEFKKTLTADPMGVMKQAGVKIEDGIKEIKVVENTPATRYLVLPLVKDGKISDDALSAMSGGVNPTVVEQMQVLDSTIIAVTEVNTDTNVDTTATAQIVATSAVQCTGSSD